MANEQKKKNTCSDCENFDLRANGITGRCQADVPMWALDADEDLPDLSPLRCAEQCQCFRGENESPILVVG